MFHEHAPQARDGGSDNQWLNVGLVVIGVACGAGYIATKKPGFAIGAAVFYTFQFIESFTSNTFAYIQNIQTPE